MIFGIGTDIVSVSRMREALGRHGERFAERILTPEEFEEFRRAADSAAFLAKRFAAKEAAAKALGTGFSDGLSLQHIGVGHDVRGKPLLRFFARAQELREELGIGEGFVSLADERDHAVAFVTLMRKNIIT